MALTPGEMEIVRLIVDGVAGKLEGKITALSGLVENKDKNVCEKIEKIEKNFVQHDKRIVKLETSLAYQIGKVAGIATIAGGLISIVVSLIQGLMK